MGSALPDLYPPVPQAGECSDTFSTFDVPIFTEEFLDQNKGEGLGCRAGAPALQHLAWGMASASSAAARAACIPRGRTTAGAACEIQAVKGPW